MTIHNHSSSDRKHLEDITDIPRGDECRQLVDQLNRNLYSISSSLQTTLKQMSHVETRIGHEISTLNSCLQENLSKCTTSYAPHEEQLVQLDSAKRNLKKLTKLLEARQIFDSEEAQTDKLRDRPIDDTLLPTLVAIGENLKTIKDLGAKPKFDIEVYLNTKDRYLTWKGTEFAVKFGTENGLDEIFDAFSTLNSVKDFHRLYQHHFDQSLSSILIKTSQFEENERKSIKEVGNSFISQATDHFRSHMTSLHKYCDEEEAFSRLLEALKTFLKSGSLEKNLEKIMETYTDYDLLTDLKSLVLNKMNIDDEGSAVEIQEVPENIDQIITNGFLECAKKPLSDKLKTMIEPPPLNFRSVAEISTSLENFSYLLKEISFQLSEIYLDNSKDFIISILKPMFTTYTTKLCKMEDNSTQKVKLEEYLERISLGGHLHTIVDDYKQQADITTGPEIKNSKKWINDRIKDAIRSSHRFVTDRMPNHGSEVYKEDPKMNKSALPTPQDFVVTATQNLLHLLRFWEEALSNEQTKIALNNYLNDGSLENSDDDTLFAAILDKIASYVVKKLLQSINDVWMTDGKTTRLSKGIVKEFLCDAEYLRDALIDLRAGTHANLDTTIEKLREQLKTMP